SHIKESGGTDEMVSAVFSNAGDRPSLGHELRPALFITTPTSFPCQANHGGNLIKKELIKCCRVGFASAAARSPRARLMGKRRPAGRMLAIDRTSPPASPRASSPLLLNHGPYCRVLPKKPGWQS